MSIFPAQSVPDFSDLAQYIAEWGLATPEARLKKKLASSLQDQTAFLLAMEPRLEEIIVFLNQYPLHEIPKEHLALSYTALAVIEVDDAVHIWKRSTLELTDDPSRWTTKNSFYGN